MRALVFVLMAAAGSATWASPAGPEPKPVNIPASLVAGQCLKESRGNGDSISAGLCTFLISGYIHGYQKGINAGVRAAFTKDRENLQTTKGIDDVVSRVSAVEKIASCIPSDVTIRKIQDLFVSYISKHPEDKERQYYGPLEQALEEAYPCK